MSNELTITKKLNIINWDKIRTEIETAKDIHVLLKLKDKLRAYQILAEQSKQSVEVQAKISIYKARSDRKCGEWLTENVKQGGDRQTEKAKLQHVTLLSDLDLTRIVSSRLQKIASIPETEFEDILLEAEEETKRITNNMLVKLARRHKPPVSFMAQTFPKDKYQVIYADPPWAVESINMDKWESPIKNKYPTMSIDEIKNLPVNSISADDCSLFLWTTHSFLHEALHIMEFWGFKYFCLITWDKGSGWTQNGFHKMTEFCIFGYKGKMNINQYGKSIPTLIKEKKGKHSKKPQEMRRLIESKIEGKKIEMFAREKFNGWDSWGNENV